MRDNKRSLDLKVKFSRTDPGMQMYLYKYLKMFDQPDPTLNKTLLTLI
jgi:hypothetical protein